jgi:hypothetical protein
LNRILGADSQDRSQNQGSRHCDFFFMVGLPRLLNCVVTDRQATLCPRFLPSRGRNSGSTWRQFLFSGRKKELTPFIFGINPAARW